MSLTATSIRNAPFVAVAVAVAVVFGVFSIVSLPVQLTPDIEIPTLTIE